MKPTLIANATAGANAGNPTMTAGGANPAGSGTNGVNIPINHEFHYPSQQPHPSYHPQQYATADANGAAYGSPNSYARQQQQPQPTQQPPYSAPHQQQQIPAHFQQGFGFEPNMDMDMDMFPRSRLAGRMHDPFAGFGGSHFGFPQFGSMGRRRQPAGDPINDDHDFFNRLPSEFRQYIPENFGHRRTTGSAMPPQQPQHPQPASQPQYYQTYVPTGTTPPTASHMPPSPSKKLCDAAIQTEDPNVDRSEVDSAGPVQTDSLNHHGLRNTVDMGVKSAAENEMHGPRSHSAPPPEQLAQQQQIPLNGKQPTPPPAGGRPQFSTQTSQPYIPAQGPGPHFQKAYYPPQQQSHPQQQQKQQTPPPPQTPGGSYVRTIPIFVEGRSEPIINSHKEIPNQHASANGAASATATASAKAGFTPQQPQQPQSAPQQQQKYHQQPPVPPQHQQPSQPQQQHRPAPLNTQQQPQAAPAGITPQTPHTIDSINKIQDIQRDVLELMGCVESFTGTRNDREYAYLDEMLTRNLLKLDTIDTNGKDSIRLARKEAIKCIQASINVLEAKAEENARNAAQSGEELPTEAAATEASEAAPTKEDQSAVDDEAQPVDASKIQAPIPLPPPEGLQTERSSSNQALVLKEATPPKGEPTAETTESK